MPSNDSTAAVLVFEDVEFDVVDLHGVPWLRGAQIGAALGYADPTRAIRKLYDRNADEFDECMTTLLELPSAGGIQSVRIFSPRGSYLLGMFSNTERGKSFRRWVLDVLEGNAAPRVGHTMTFPQHLAALRYRGTLVEKLAKTIERGSAIELYANLRQISRLLGMGVCELEQLAPALKQASLPGV